MSKSKPIHHYAIYHPNGRGEWSKGTSIKFTPHSDGCDTGKVEVYYYSLKVYEHLNCSGWHLQQTEREPKPKSIPEPDPADNITEEQKKAIKVLYPWAKWVAMDKNGNAFIYEDCPKISSSENHWNVDNNDSGESEFLMLLKNYSSDWKNSLVEL